MCSREDDPSTHDREFQPRLVCNHARYADRHCVNPYCLNYYNRCPKHVFMGDDRAKCERDIIALSIRNARAHLRRRAARQAIV